MLNYEAMTFEISSWQ